VTTSEGTTSDRGCGRGEETDEVESSSSAHGDTVAAEEEANGEEEVERAGRVEAGDERIVSAIEACEE
jgi:hypothetical protein